MGGERRRPSFGWRQSFTGRTKGPDSVKDTVLRKPLTLNLNRPRVGFRSDPSDWSPRTRKGSVYLRQTEGGFKSARSFYVT